MNIWNNAKRVLAMLMVFSLVFSMVPVSVFATGADTVSEVKVYVQPNTVDLANYDAVVLVDGVEADMQENITLEADGKTAVVTFDGLSVTVDKDVNVDAATAAVWSATCTTTDKTIYVGGAAATLEGFTADTGCEFDSSMYSVTTESTDITVNGTSVEAVNETVGAAVVEKIEGTNGLYAKNEITVVVSAPVVTSVEFKVGTTVLTDTETLVGMTGDVVVTVTIAAEGTLPAVEMGGVQYSDWTDAGAGTWTQDVPVAEGVSTLTVAGETAVLNLNKTAPTVQVDKAYVNGAGKIVVNLSGTFASCGLDSLTVNGNPVATVDGTGTFTATVELDSETPFDAVVTDNSGLSASLDTAGTVQPALGVNFSVNKTGVDDGSTHYYKERFTITAQATGVDDGSYKLNTAASQLTYKDNGADKTADPFKIKSNNSASFGTPRKSENAAEDIDHVITDVTATVTDASGRTITVTSPDTYIYDVTAPVVNLDLADGTYFEKDGSIWLIPAADGTVTISGSVIEDYFAWDNTNCTGDVVTFASDNTFTYTNSDTDTVEDLSLGTIKDLAGNDAVITVNGQAFTGTLNIDRTAPTVELKATVDGEACVVYTTGAGKHYICVVPVTNTTENAPVVVKIEGEVKDNAGSNMTGGSDVVWDGQKFTYSVTCNPDKVTTINLPLTFVDMSGNKADAAKLTAKGTDSDTVVDLTIADGKIEKLYVDRKMPVVGTAPNFQFEDGLNQLFGDIYTNTTGGKLTFTVKITDANSGLYIASDPNEVGTEVSCFVDDVELDGVAVYEDGLYKIKLSGLDIRSENVVLKARAVDNAGNVFESSRTVKVDTMAPTVTVTFDNNEFENEKYFDAPRKATVTVEDLDFDASLINIATTGTVTWDDHVATVEFAADGAHTLKITGKDLAGHTLKDANVDYSAGEPHTNFVIDTVAPTVKVTFNNNSAENDRYFKANRTATVKFTEANFDASLITIDTTGTVTWSGKTATVVFDTDGEHTLSISGQDKAGNTFADTDVDYTACTCPTNFVIDKVAPSVVVTFDNNSAENGSFFKANRTASVVVTEVNFDETMINIDTTGTVTWNGQTATVVFNTDGVHTLAISGQDKAGNTFADTDVDYTACTVPTDFVIDTVAPVVTVEKTVETGAQLVQTFGNVDYYNGEVTYTVTATDDHLDPLTNSVAKVTYNDGSEQVVDLFNGAAATDTPDTFTESFTVVEGKTVSSIEISVVDNAGNAAASVSSVTDADSKTTFNGMSYNGNPVVVDKTAPTAAIAITGNVDSYYVNAARPNVIYVKLSSPATGDSGAAAAQENETVTVTVTVTDKNLTLDAGNANSVVNNLTNGVAWTGTPAVNADSTVTYTQSVEVAADSTGLVEFDFTAFDLAGHVLENLEVVAQNNSSFDSTKLACKDSSDAVIPGRFAGTASVDRRRPASVDDATVAPVITITPDAAFTTSNNGLDLFSGEFNYALTVTDGANNEDNAGLASVTWKIEDEVGFVVESEATNTDLGYTENFTIPVTVDGTGESNSAVLTITAIDNVGNTTVFVKNFAVDNQAPRISVSYDNNDVANGRYFKADRVATVTVEDINFDPATTIATEVTPTEWVKDGDVYTATCTYNADGNYTIAVESTDKANNNTPDSEVDYSGESVHAFTIDKSKPAVTVVKTVETGNGFVQADDTNKVDYYDGNVTYTVTVTDNYLDALADSVAVVKYVDGEEHEINLFGELTADDATFDADTLTGTFTITEGNDMTAFSIAVKDNAGNEATDVTVNDAESRTSFNGMAYNGNKIIVDKTAPEVEVTKTIETDAEYVQSYKGVDYYNGEVTYTVKASDAHLDDLSGSAAQVIYNDGSVQTIDLFDGAAATDATDEFTASFKVVEGKTVSAIEITVKDNAGHVAAAENITSEDALTPFATKSDATGVTYTGNKVVADKTAPTATIEISGNVESYYVNANRPGVIYVRLKNPAVAQSGAFATQAAETVTLTVVANDLNVALDAENTYGVKNNLENNGAWSGSTPVNASSTVTYTQTVTVEHDSTGLIVFDINVNDLAGNALAALEVKGLENGNTFDSASFAKGNGNFAGTASVDRRRPSSVDNDIEAPVITIEPSIAFTTSNNNLDLFSTAFNYALTVTDGVENDNNSGLESVHWTITDPIKFVNNSDVTKDEGLGYTSNLTIPVTVNGEGESNSVKLTIEATDNAGNMTTFEKEFAVDNLAPRVTVTYDNNSVMNEKYFKADRVATVTVEDINFNPETTTITTEVAPSAWSANGDVYTATCVYASDADYTFTMTSTDKANNNTPDTAVTYNGVAVHEFTVDKTAPVITLTYDNNDVRNDKYFNAGRTGTISIIEHNFNASEVQVPMTASLDGESKEVPAVSAWSRYGDNNTAVIDFNFEGDFTIGVSYTDLAGNAAVTEAQDAFTIDWTKPVIDLNIGDMEAFKDDVIPVIGITDINLDLDGYSIVTQRSFGMSQLQDFDLNSSTLAIEHGVELTYTNLSIEKGNDGVYYLEARAVDMAGNEAEIQRALYSVNRFGSTYRIGDDMTADALGKYLAQSRKLVFVEINPDEVSNQSITVVVNGKSTVLVEGTDYTVQHNHEDGTWHEYIYTINESVFMNGDQLVNGYYSITLYSEDGNNINTNANAETLSENDFNSEITFWMDDEKPIIAIAGVESGDRVRADSLTVTISAMDSSPITVYVNNEEVKLDENGQFTLTLKESSSIQTVTVTAVDMAGNEETVVRDNILITTNIFIQYIHSVPALAGTAGIAVAGGGAAWYAIFRKKKLSAE